MTSKVLRTARYMRSLDKQNGLLPLTAARKPPAISPRFPPVLAPGSPLLVPGSPLLLCFGPS